jgi:hypothetical protein
MDTNAKKFLLVEYDSAQPADIGSYDIRKVQKNGKNRYMPFVTSLDLIKKIEETRIEKLASKIEGLNK